MNPVAFRIGPFAVHWYGILVVSGALAAAFITGLEAKRRGEDPDHAWNVLLWCLLAGLVGARLYHVFSYPQGVGRNWDFYRQHPEAILKIWEGGLGIYGAVAGGVLALYIYTQLNRLSFGRWLDCGAPGLILAQAIGRWGNFFNQELYGYPTDLPWGIYISPAYRLPGLEAYERFHPTFLYESLWNLAGFALLMFVARRFSSYLLDGDVFCLYAIYYPLGRIWVEALRPDSWMVGPIRVAHIVSALSIVLALAIILYRHRFAPART
ncbi:MAG: prolipoprotein diacylglyceryl transferase [Anaerolineae bacterium]